MHVGLRRASGSGLHQDGRGGNQPTITDPSRSSRGCHLLFYPCNACVPGRWCLRPLPDTPLRSIRDRNNRYQFYRGWPLCTDVDFVFSEHPYMPAWGIHLRPRPRVPWKLNVHNYASFMGLGGFRPTMDTPLRSIRLLITLLMLGECL